MLTGGATGIGAAIKRQLLDQGHDIVVIDLKDGDYLRIWAIQQPAKPSLTRSKRIIPALMD